MNIIVPMAGMGKRMRPHTLTVPKPLIPIAGKPIVQRLVEDIAAVAGSKIDEVGFIIGDFGQAVENQLLDIAKSLGAKGKIYYQTEALGTAHAILCAKESLKGPSIVAFADTLFRADFSMNTSSDGVLWVSQIDDPSAFGVVKVNESNVITDFVEKPKDFVSDLAMIGIYYFKSGESLRDECQYLIDNAIINDGEYQLPDALRNMTAKGMQFNPGKVKDWLDCGNKNATLDSNQRVLGFIADSLSIPTNVTIENSTIIQPCYIGEGATIKSSVVGPHVSIGDGTIIENSVIKNSIIQSNSEVKQAVVDNSMIGHFAKYCRSFDDLSIGDYSTINS
jgi:glucose-1-phosphate thymidylyltransferase|tara:strand:- start:370 stop:1374 length:1005 start_codon:yes stop_codon:yes gene_type:complete